MLLRRLALAAVPVLVIVAGCGSDKNAETATTAPATSAAATTAAPATAAASGPTTAAAGGSTITAADFGFSPPTLTVKAGTAVEIKNNQGVPHTFTADDGSFDLELDPNGGGGTHTFATAGSFPYHCSIHPSMKGTVVVEG